MADVAAAAGGETVIAVLGDSLTAGFGLSPEDAFPAQLETRLRRDGLDVRAVNAGVSGDTSAGGRARLDWVLADTPDLVIVELGANDALRGLAPAETEANLDAAVFPRLADKYAVPFYPFFLDGVAAQPRLNQADGIHPNVEGVAEIVTRIAPYVRRVIDPG